MKFDPVSYDQWYEDNREIFQKEVKVISEAGIKGRSIEIGAGTGRFAGELGMSFALDSSREMISLARGRVENLIVGSACHLPFRDKSFETLLFAFSMSFINCKEQAIREAMRVSSSIVLLDFDPADSYVKTMKSQYPEIEPLNTFDALPTKLTIKIKTKSGEISLIMVHLFQ